MEFVQDVYAHVSAFWPFYAAGAAAIPIMTAACLLDRRNFRISASNFLEKIMSRDEDFMFEWSNSQPYDRTEEVREHAAKIKRRYSEKRPFLEIEKIETPQGTAYKGVLMRSLGNPFSVAPRKIKQEYLWRRNLLLQAIEEYDQTDLQPQDS